MVTVEYAPCLLFCGSFEPAYILTITALPAQLQPTTNKRNAALVQAFMTELLGVDAERGIIRFQPIPEENLSTNGVTMLGELERVEKQQAEEGGGGLKRALTRASKSSMNLKRKESLSSQAARRDTTSPPRPSQISSMIPETEEGDEVADTDERHVHVGAPSPSPWRNAEHPAFRTPPPIPQEPRAKVSKRKSFMAVFRR